MARMHGECTHCKKVGRIIGRKLCGACYDKPAVRDLYPTNRTITEDRCCSVCRVRKDSRQRGLCYICYRNPVLRDQQPKSKPGRKVPTGPLTAWQKLVMEHAFPRVKNFVYKRLWERKTPLWEHDELISCVLEQLCRDVRRMETDDLQGAVSFLLACADWAIKKVLHERRRRRDQLPPVLNLGSGDTDGRRVYAGRGEDQL